MSCEKFRISLRLTRRFVNLVRVTPSVCVFKKFKSFHLQAAYNIETMEACVANKCLTATEKNKSEHFNFQTQ